MEKIFGRCGRDQRAEKRKIKIYQTELTAGVLKEKKKIKNTQKVTQNTF